VPGVSLRALLASEKTLAPESALAILKGSLLGLAAAHAAGIVHRDYKPGNVLVSREGESKLVDFGLATLNGQSGLAAGSPSYMAPEQWAGMPGRPATDVYAATCVFFQCITGHRPFEAGTTEGLRSLHESAPVPLDAVPTLDLVPAGVVELVRRELLVAPGAGPRGRPAGEPGPGSGLDPQLTQDPVPPVGPCSVVRVAGSGHDSTPSDRGTTRFAK